MNKKCARCGLVFFGAVCPKCGGAMAEKPCLKCRASINAIADKCPNCGAGQLKSRPSLLLILALAGLIPIAFLSPRVGRRELPASLETKNKPSLTADQREMLNNFIRSGLLSLDPSARKAYLSPAFWIRMTAKEKETFSGMVAVECSQRDGATSYCFVEIVDDRSGKTLATWDNLWGYKVH